MSFDTKALFFKFGTVIGLLLSFSNYGYSESLGPKIERLYKKGASFVYMIKSVTTNNKHEKIQAYVTSTESIGDYKIVEVTFSFRNKTFNSKIMKNLGLETGGPYLTNGRHMYLILSPKGVWMTWQDGMSLKVIKTIMEQNSTPTWPYEVTKIGPEPNRGPADKEYFYRKFINKRMSICNQYVHMSDSGDGYDVKQCFAMQAGLNVIEVTSPWSSFSLELKKSSEEAEEIAIQKKKFWRNDLKLSHLIFVSRNKMMLTDYNSTIAINDNINLTDGSLELDDLQKKLASSSEKKNIGICAQNNASFGLIKRIIYTAHKAKFKGYALANLKTKTLSPQPKLEHCQVSLDLVGKHFTTKLGPKVQNKVMLALVVDKKGYNLIAGAESISIPKQRKAFDTEILMKRLREIKARMPEKNDIFLSFDNDLNYLIFLNTVTSVVNVHFNDWVMADDSALGQFKKLQAKNSFFKTSASSPETNIHKTPLIAVELNEVNGALDKEIIRRIIRRHINEIKYCYQRSLQKSPKSAGALSVQFTISSSGNVLKSSLVEPHLKEENFDSCLKTSIKRWLFPKPRNGGMVNVKATMKFHLVTQQSGQKAKQI